MTQSSNTKGALKDVLTRVVDSADGYESAAEDASQGRFAVMFREKAQERRGFATELRGTLTSMGETPEEDGSLLAAGHRVFKDIRDALTGGGDEAVLREVERGENALLSQYDDALKDVSAGDPAHDMLHRQRESVNQTLSTVRSYENDA